MTVVLATCRKLPELDKDDQLLYQALKQAGLSVEIAVWDDPVVDWSRYAMCVIRSTWDYVPRRAEYLGWAERVAEKTTLWNSPELLRWNTDKTYLKDLEDQGLPVVPTGWLPAGTDASAFQCPEGSLWDELVIKPTISASGQDTFRIKASGWGEALSQIQPLLSERELMVQPFMRTVQTIGEYAFLFFNGRFSHAILKRPKAGEFRVQEHFGGNNQPIQPTLAQLQFAQQVMDQLPAATLYARVDAIEDENGQLLVSEVELTEPSMYLSQDANAPGRFVEAIRERLVEV